MPIYLEARNVTAFGTDLLGFSGGHMYLVYVPEGEENNYDAWQTIGAFPENTAIPPGPWGLLDVRFKDGALLRSSIDRYDEDDVANATLALN